MTAEPIVKIIEVARSPEDAFEVFVTRMASWWPLSTHCRAVTAKGERAVDILIEPKVGGRVAEKLDSGELRDWGHVTVYEPGRRFAMNWRMGRPAEQGTDLEVMFEALGAGRCRVRLTHSGWERLGEDGATMRGRYGGGWVTVFEECYGKAAGRLS